jgi:hypothetical protein
MINQTLFLAFTDPISAADLETTLVEIEQATRATGLVESFAARPHLAVPGEEAIPAFIGSAVVQLGVADLNALGTLFATTEIDDVFHALRETHPYTTAWVNHEPLT